MPFGVPFQKEVDPFQGRWDADGYGDSVRQNGIIPPAPTYFRVTLNVSKYSLTIRVGNSGKALGLAGAMISKYRVRFIPLSSLSRTDVRDPVKLFFAWGSADVICELAALPSGANVSYTDSSVVGISGWFFASSVNHRGGESDATAPFPAPTDPSLINYAIPADPQILSATQTLIPYPGSPPSSSTLYKKLDFELRPPGSASFLGVQPWIGNFGGSSDLLEGPMFTPPAPLNKITATMYLENCPQTITVYFVSVSQGRTHREDVTGAPSATFASS